MLIDRNAHSALGAVTLLTLFRVIWGERGVGEGVVSPLSDRAES